MKTGPQPPQGVAHLVGITEVGSGNGQAAMQDAVPSMSEIYSGLPLTNTCDYKVSIHV